MSHPEPHHLDVDEEGRLQAQPAEMSRFVLSGFSIFTLENRARGTHLTFRVEASEDGGVWFVRVLTGPDNLRDYSVLGTIFRKGGVYRHNDRKSRIRSDATAALAFAWFWDRVRALEALPDAVRVYHLGWCGRCGRPLTHPVSKRVGLGPTCRRLLGSSPVPAPADVESAVRTAGEALGLPAPPVSAR